MRLISTFRNLLVTACVASALMSQSAHAAIVFVTYTGEITRGIDGAGMFGDPGQDLAGQSYTAQYTFDTDLGLTYTGLTASSAGGGTYTGNASPNTFFAMSTGGRTAVFEGSYYSSIFAESVPGFSRMVHTVSNASHVGLTNYVADTSMIFPADISSPLSVSLLGVRDRFGAFESGSGTSLDLAPTYLTIYGPVPEPETYAMLLAGLGLLGFAARRRKQKEAAAA